MGIKLSKEQAESLDSYLQSLPEEKRSSFIKGFDELPDKGKIGLTNELMSSFKKPGAFAKQETPQPQGDIFQQRGEIAQAEIAKRGNLLEQIPQNLQSPNMLRKGLGGLQALGAPMTMMEGGLSNVGLKLQQGDPTNLGQEFMAGITGQKQGQYGDIFRVVGVPEPLSALGGLMIPSALPFAIVDKISDTFGKISRLSDKGIMRAGRELINGADEAGKFSKARLDSQFAKVDKVKIDPASFYDEISKLPNALINKLEAEFGKLENVALNLTVGRLREIKGMIGKYNPGSFGREARGLSENLNADEINKIYGSIKNLMEKSMVGAVKPKEIARLLNLEDKSTEVIRSIEYLKRTIVEPTLRKPTKAGNMAKKVVLEGDVSGREALNVLRSQGSKARNAINNAKRALDAFNVAQGLTKVAKHALSAATYGGAIGAIGGGIASKALKRGERE